MGAALLFLGGAAACVSNPPLISVVPPSTCAARSGPEIVWARVAPPGEYTALDRWCAAVGPPLRMGATHGTDVFAGSFAVVSWNTHIGAGDIETLVRDLRAGHLTGGRPVSSFVLLLQEAFRVRAGIARHDDVAASARKLGLFTVYVPSMRNGSRAAEDRGNAILSTFPLTDIAAIELPLERQRRVAIAATLTVPTQPGATTVRLLCVHLSNMVPRRLWVMAELGRRRQARALGTAIPKSGATVLGGDLNSWFGVRDAAYRELARVLPASDRAQRLPTYGPFRLDHLFIRLPGTWRASIRRADSRYGSDHYPLAAMIDTMRANDLAQSAPRVRGDRARTDDRPARRVGPALRP